MDMHISLPPDLQEFVESEAAERDFSDGAEFVRDLIRREQAKQRLRDLLLEGLNSPIAGEADDAYFEGLRRRAAGEA